MDEDVFVCFNLCGDKDGKELLISFFMLVFYSFKVIFKVFFLFFYIKICNFFIKKN